MKILLQKSKRKKILPPDARLPAFLTCLANLMTAHLQVMRMRTKMRIMMRTKMRTKMSIMMRLDMTMRLTIR